MNLTDRKRDGIPYIDLCDSCEPFDKFIKKLLMTIFKAIFDEQSGF